MSRSKTVCILVICASIIVALIPFIPEFLKQTLPSLNLDMSSDENRGFSLKYQHKMANSVMLRQVKL